MRAAASSPETKSRRGAGNLSGAVNAWAVLAVPVVGFLLLFFAYPTFEILTRSVRDFSGAETSGLDNFAWFFQTDVNITVLVRTVWVAAAVTALCLGLGYPFAYFMTIAARRVRLTLLVIVIVADVMSLLVRSYAWVIILQASGPLSDVLSVVGFEGVRLTGTTFAVVLALTQILLPLMILPLYANMRGIDRRLLAAAKSLGASPIRAFRSVYLPLSVPGIAAGSLLVFVLSIGFYVTPTLVGSPTNALMSQLIVSQIAQLLAWGHAGAISVVMLVVTLLLLLLLRASRGRTPSLVATQVAYSESNQAGAPVRSPLGLTSFVVAVFLIVPMLVVFPVGFSSQRSLLFPPPGLSVQWYVNFLSEPEWYGSMLMSVWVALLATGVSTVLGTCAAFALVRGRFPGRSVLQPLVLAPMIVPLVITGVGIYATFLEWQLIGSTAAFVVAHTVVALPFVFVPIVAGLETFDRHLESAAASLGASPVAVARRVTLPIVLPSVLTGAFFAFVTSFDETVISLFLATADARTLPVQMYVGMTRQTDPTVAAASSLVVIATLVLVVIALFVRRGRVVDA
jgi:putative spermidine/putrescine transport system permease protein